MFRFFRVQNGLHPHNHQKSSHIHQTREFQDEMEDQGIQLRQLAPPARVPVVGHGDREPAGDIGALGGALPRDAGLDAKVLPAPVLPRIRIEVQHRPGGIPANGARLVDVHRAQMLAAPVRGEPSVDLVQHDLPRGFSGGGGAALDGGFLAGGVVVEDDDHSRRKLNCRMYTL